MLPLPTTAAFLQAIAVNVHIEYTDTPYRDAAAVLRDLGFIGVSLVRDAAPDPRNAGQGSYAMLADRKIRFDFFIPSWNNDLGAVLPRIDAFAHAHPGAVAAIEGPNEIENWPVTYQGATGVPAAARFQHAIFAAVRADSALKGVPVYDLTFSTGFAGLYSVLGDMADACDVGTDHTYFGNRRPPRGGLTGAVAHVSAFTPGRPIAVTETGYTTAQASPHGVSEQDQALYTIDLLLDAARAGVVHTYLYELLDEKPDPAGTNGERHFGLFHSDHSPKPVAIALHNMTRALAQGSSAGTPRNPDRPNTAGLPATAATLDLVRSDGGRDLFIWDEPVAASSPTDAHDVQVILPRPAASVQVFDPMNDSAPAMRLVHVNHVSLHLGRDPLLVQIQFK